MIRIVIDFLWISILVSLLLGLLASVLPALGQSGTFIATIAAALGAGLFHGRRTGVEATRRFAWKAAAAITVTTLVLVALFIAILRRSGAFEELDAVSPLSYALGVFFVGLVTLLLARFFFRWGTRRGAAHA